MSNVGLKCFRVLMIDGQAEAQTNNKQNYKYTKEQ